MNDDELGRTLGTALAAPEVHAAPGAGARLRARAGGDRRRHVALAGVAAAAAVLLVVGMVRLLPGAPAPDGPVGPPVLIRLATALQLATPACAGPDCPPPLRLGVDEVRSIAPAAGGVRVQLSEQDLDTVAVAAAREVAVSAAGRTLARDVAVTAAGELTVPAEDPAALLRTLGPYRPVVRTGPGPFMVPLELWDVRAATPGPCPQRPARPKVLVADLGRECLTLVGPGLRLTEGDVEVRRPEGTNPHWRVGIDVDAAGGRALGDFTRTRGQKRVAFVVGGKVAIAPTIQGRIDGSLEVVGRGLDSEAAVNSLVARLRP